MFQLINDFITMNIYQQLIQYEPISIFICMKNLYQSFKL